MGRQRKKQPKKDSRKDRLDIDKKESKKDKPIGCSMCSQSFADEHLHREHVRYNHIGLICKYPGCGFQFNTEKELRTHLGVHVIPHPEDAKQFSCGWPLCPNAFKTTVSARRHLLHHTFNINGGFRKEIHKSVRRPLPEKEDSTPTGENAGQQITLSVHSDRDQSQQEASTHDESRHKANNGGPSTHRTATRRANNGGPSTANASTNSGLDDFVGLVDPDTLRQIESIIMLGPMQNRVALGSSSLPQGSRASQPHNFNSRIPTMTIESNSPDQGQATLGNISRLVNSTNNNVNQTQYGQLDQGYRGHINPTLMSRYVTDNDATRMHTPTQPRQPSQYDAYAYPASTQARHRGANTGLMTPPASIADMDEPMGYLPHQNDGVYGNTTMHSIPRNGINNGISANRPIENENDFSMTYPPINELMGNTSYASPPPESDHTDPSNGVNPASQGDDNGGAPGAHRSQRRRAPRRQANDKEDTQKRPQTTAQPRKRRNRQSTEPTETRIEGGNNAASSSAMPHTEAHQATVSQPFGANVSASQFGGGNNAAFTPSAPYGYPTQPAGSQYLGSHAAPYNAPDAYQHMMAALTQSVKNHSLDNSQPHEQRQMEAPQQNAPGQQTYDDLPVDPALSGIEYQKQATNGNEPDGELDEFDGSDNQ
ncbi:uncharacterized protein GGS25DRAFT_524807 [Hypoxylon fragiforme]|uniref:uncharacterized protein n=1 Tax=Hypoxylon fragiforme TaxID=63214 RepID=UPI0020C6418F|nr:uncharacterized protein GGS25DRAFT_524807 [Hypoxylon fragiforme]KAI2605290.1 hypothetical protein GGS25DRAFT_524807 [Hypoxylon fragiforme]